MAAVDRRVRLNAGFSFILPLICFVFISCDGFEYSKHVVILDGSNFNSTLSSEEIILVKFYAPWCGHCKSMAPKYSKVAEKMKEASPDIKCAAFNADENKDIAEAEHISQYPTIRLYKAGRYFEYEGKPEVEDILKWVDMRMKPPIVPLPSWETLESMRKEHHAVFVSLIPDNTSQAYLTLSELAEHFSGDPLFTFVMDNSELKDRILAEVNNKASQIVVFKQFDEGRDYLAEYLDDDSIQRFVRANTVPLLTDFDPNNAKLLFDIRVNVLLFVGNQTESPKVEKRSVDSQTIATLRSHMTESAKKFRGDVAFAHIDTDSDDNARILQFFDIVPSDLPTIRLVKFAEDLLKYKFEGSEITEATITDFVERCMDGTIEPQYKSEELPDDWNKGPVTVLVQSNFVEIAMDTSKSVLVEFFAPWCGVCQQLEPVYNSLGSHFNDTDDVIIAKIDATKNDIASIPIRQFPTIMLFPKGEKYSEPIAYNGTRTLEDLINFVETNRDVIEKEAADDQPTQPESEPEDHKPKEEL